MLIPQIRTKTEVWASYTQKDLKDIWQDQVVTLGPNCLKQHQLFSCCWTRQVSSHDVFLSLNDFNETYWAEMRPSHCFITHNKVLRLWTRVPSPKLRGLSPQQVIITSTEPRLTVLCEIKMWKKVRRCFISIFKFQPKFYLPFLFSRNTVVSFADSQQNSFCCKIKQQYYH